MAKFGKRPGFMLPDRSKYVNMERRFLSSYRQLLVATAHARGAPATGGMAANIVDTEDVIEAVVSDKRKEIAARVDGFLIYDLALAKPCRKLWAEMKGATKNIGAADVTESDLLDIPSGGVTMDGLKLNIRVAVLFIYNWLVTGRGCFEMDNRAEDSATAEISRSQVWQWLYHGAHLEPSGNMVTFSLVRDLVTGLVSETGDGNMKMAGDMYLDIVTRHEMPEFITTLLSDSYYFRFVCNS